MKTFLEIKTEEGTIIFQGKALTLPIREDAIKTKSMEVFRDPDPCIIHQSYVIQIMVESLIEHLPKDKGILGKDIPMDLSFIQINDVNQCMFFLKE